MPRTRRYHPRLPTYRLTPHLKLNSPPILHDIPMHKPIPIPHLPVNLHALHEITVRVVQIGRRHAEGVVAVDRHVDVGEPGRVEEVDGLGHDGVEAEHLPEHPGVERAGVGVTGDAVGGVVEVGVAEGAGGVDGFGLFVEVVVFVGGCEVW